MLTIGTKAPDFTLQDQAGKKHALDDYKGFWVLLYFYPKDDTPGCTVEACSMRDNKALLEKLKTVVLGVSKDTVESHRKFAKKYTLSFPILADPDMMVIKAYQAFGQKSMFGKKYMGIKRVSYLIDPKGKIAKVYTKVNPAGHVQEVQADVSEQQP